MEYNEIIAGKIAFLCSKNQMTTSQLASVCKMNRATIENIMSGKCRRPRIQTLYKISGAFHMSVQEFLDFSQEGEQCLDGDPSTPAPHPPVSPAD